MAEHRQGEGLPNLVRRGAELEADPLFEPLPRTLVSQKGSFKEALRVPLKGIGFYSYPKGPLMLPFWTDVLGKAQTSNF